jgi:excisionase family DNA binding protein
MFSFSLVVCPHCDFRGVQANGGVMSGKASGYIECPECGVLMERHRDATQEEVRSLRFLRRNSTIPICSRGLATCPRIQPSAPPRPAYQSESEQWARLNSIPDDRLLTAREAAKILGMSYNLFNKKVRAGEIVYVKFNGRERRFYPRHLKDYLESKTVRPKPATDPAKSRKPANSRNRVSKRKQISNSEWRETMKDW